MGYASGYGFKDVRRLSALEFLIIVLVVAIVCLVAVPVALGFKVGGGRYEEVAVAAPSVSSTVPVLSDVLKGLSSNELVSPFKTDGVLAVGDLYGDGKVLYSLTPYDSVVSSASLAAGDRARDFGLTVKVKDGYMVGLSNGVAYYDVVDGGIVRLR